MVNGENAKAEKLISLERKGNDMVVPVIARGLLAGAKALSKTPAGKKLLKQAISKGKTLLKKAKPKKSTMAGDIAKFKKGMSKAKPRGRGAGARAYATTGAAVGGTGLAASAGKGKSKNPRKRKTA